MSTILHEIDFAGGKLSKCENVICEIFLKFQVSLTRSSCSAKIEVSRCSTNYRGLGYRIQRNKPEKSFQNYELAIHYIHSAVKS